MKRAFSLLEMLLVLGLISLLLSMLLSVVVRLSSLARSTTQASLRRKHWVQAAETLRWQLRNLFQPPALQDPKAAPNAAGLVGSPETPLWGEPGQQEGFDTLVFLTTQARRKKGVCEIAVRLQASGQSYVLAYREFPLRHRAGLHPVSIDLAEAPWNTILGDVTHLSLDYSEDGWTWRRDWSETKPPRRIRLHLEARGLPTLDFQVTPALGAGRW